MMIVEQECLPVGTCIICITLVVCNLRQSITFFGHIIFIIPIFPDVLARCVEREVELRGKPEAYHSQLGQVWFNSIKNYTYEKAENFHKFHIHKADSTRAPFRATAGVAPAGATFLDKPTFASFINLNPLQFMEMKLCANLC